MPKKKKKDPLQRKTCASRFSAQVIIAKQFRQFSSREVILLRDVILAAVVVVAS